MSSPNRHNSGILPSYEEIMTYLGGFTNYERMTDYISGPEKLGLGRISRLLEQIGSPQLQYDALHIAGTKGKGSTATLTARLLSANGLKVGLYTSPHLISIRERIEIDGIPITREAFCENFTTLRPVLEMMKSSSEWQPPTYFEILTALAFLAFARANIDVAVVETGLGGRYDATNILKPVAAAITSISLDHTRQLGNTLELIAGEKAGIIKPKTPLILGRQTPVAAEVILQTASENNAPARILERDFSATLHRENNKSDPVKNQQLDITTWNGVYSDIRLPLLGRHQTDNAATSAALTETYLEQTDRPPLLTSVFRKAWKNIRIPARLEIIGSSPWTILDGAHNPASIWTLCETLRENFKYRKMSLVFGSAADKDVSGMLKIILPLADSVFPTEIGTNRSLPVEDLTQMIQQIKPLRVQPELDWLEAIRKARELSGPDGLVIITGSLYLAGNILSQMLAEKMTI